MDKLTPSSVYGFKTPPGDIGVEIEAEAANRLPGSGSIPGDWAATTDGSLRGNAIEYVSAFPIRIDALQTHVNGLKEAIKRHGTRINHSFRAGVHIHINACHLTLDQIADFASTYYILEHALTRYCGNNREGNLFCLRLEDAEAPLFFLENALMKNDFHQFETDNIRYSALNFRSLSRHGSLEFRAMETTPDFEKVIPWATMLYNMREWSIRNPRLKYADNISLLGPENWAQQVIGPELFQLIKYSDFNKDVIRGLRRIQPLLYLW